MLAVQRHHPQAMASDREQDYVQMFGLTPTDDTPFPNAPEPPQGAPLLSANELKALDSFFEGMTTNQPLYATAAGGPIHSEVWMELPPQLVGSTSFFGHNSEPLRDASDTQDFLERNFASSMAMLPPRMPHMAHTNAQHTTSHPSQAPHTPHTPHTPHSALSPLARPPSSSAGHINASAPRTASVAGDQFPSDEVLEAASVLQGGSLASRAHSFHFDGRPGLARAPGAASRSASTSAVSPAALLVQGGERPPSSVVAAAAAGATHADFPEVMFAPDVALVAMSTAGSAPSQKQAPELRWGSDQSFNNEQYRPQSENETEEALVSQHLKTMECLEMSQSAAVTRASSPVFDNGGLNHLQLKTRTSAMLAADGHGGGAGSGNEDESNGSGAAASAAALAQKRPSLYKDGMGPPEGPSAGGAAAERAASDAASNATSRKRKALVYTNGHDDQSPPESNGILASPDRASTAAHGARGSRSRSNGSAASTPPPPGKRRRSTVAATAATASAEAAAAAAAAAAASGKQPRENLTEEQKRENHIKSEQKRRTLIKGGFDDLCQLVPGLQGGGFSKSVMLTMAGDWLEGLLQGNARLREQLRQMDGA